MSLFAVQLTNELHKLFARPRSYLGLAAIPIVECALLFVLHRPQSLNYFRRLIEQHGLSFDQYFSGLTLGVELVIWTSSALGALSLALIASDVMSKEVQEGTLQMTLCRPVSRARIVTVKYAACIIYTFALTFFVAGTSLMAGLLDRGMGGLFVWSPAEELFAAHEAGAGLTRFAAAMPGLALSLTSVTSLGFLFSCMRLKPATVTISTLSIVLVDSAARHVPYFESLRPWFLASHLAAWQQIFALTIPWKRLGFDYACLLAVDAICLSVALAIFERRDFKR